MQFFFSDSPHVPPEDANIFASLPWRVPEVPPEDAKFFQWLAACSGETRTQSLHSSTGRTLRDSRPADSKARAGRPRQWAATRRPPPALPVGRDNWTVTPVNFRVWLRLTDSEIMLMMSRWAWANLSPGSIRVCHGRNLLGPLASWARTTGTSLGRPQPQTWTWSWSWTWLSQRPRRHSDSASNSVFAGVARRPALGLPWLLYLQIYNCPYPFSFAKAITCCVVGWNYNITTYATK